MSWTCKRCETINTDNLVECEVCLGTSPYIAQMEMEEKEDCTLLCWKMKGDCEQAKLLYCGLEVEISTHLREVCIRGKRAKEITFILENEVAERTYTYDIEGPEPILQIEEPTPFIVEEEPEILSTEVTKEDLKNAWTDEYGVQYSPDGKRLLVGNPILRDYIVREGTKCICKNTFKNSKLNLITLPDSLIKVNRCAFCNSYPKIICNSKNFIVVGNALYDKNKTTLLYYFGNETSITNLPENLTKIEEFAFCKNRSLQSITLPINLTCIGDNSFFNCTSLTGITLPDSLTSIGSGAFHGCESLESITLPDNLTSIGNIAFRDCSSLTSITLPDSLTSIGSGAFHGCESLESITLPDSLTNIGIAAFRDCKSLKNITLPDSLTSIEIGTFMNCSSLASIYFPIGLTSIDRGAFMGCSSLGSIILPEGIKSIGSSTFRDCKFLSCITLPDSLISIGAKAFQGTQIDVLKIFSKHPNFVILYGGLYNKEKTILLDYLGNESVISNLPNTLTSIGKLAFCECKFLESITLPEVLTNIGIAAFWGCSSLTSITLPDSLASIGDEAFSGCSSLANIYVSQEKVEEYKKMLGEEYAKYIKVKE